MDDHVFLRVPPMKDVMTLRKKGKLSPHYIDPFEILDKVGVVAYSLALPPELSMIHPVFHMSMLRKYHPIHHMCLLYTLFSRMKI